jgi:hypothetical protein
MSCGKSATRTTLRHAASDRVWPDFALSIAKLSVGFREKWTFERFPGNDQRHPIQGDSRGLTSHESRTVPHAGWWYLLRLLPFDPLVVQRAVACLNLARH